MFKVDGDNFFKNNVFSWSSWSADVLQSPEEVYHVFNGLNILGKRIKTIKAVGYGYNLDEVHIEEFIYRYSIDHGKSPKNGKGSIDPSWYDDSIPFPVWMEIDEPVIIVFDNGDRLEIDFSEGSSVRISKNCIPFNIEAGINVKNFFADKLFTRCIGETLIGIEVKRVSYPGFFTGSHGIAFQKNQNEYIENVSLLLTGGLKIIFNAFYDYGHVSLANLLGEPVNISLGDLRQALFFKWESTPENNNELSSGNAICEQQGAYTEERAEDEDTENTFYGEHFEALGEVWSALLGDAEKITTYLSEAIVKGKKTDQKTIVHNGEKIEVIMLHYPADGLIKIGILLVKSKNDDSWIFYSSFPIFNGLSNLLSITGAHTWKNGVEGSVAAERAGGPPVTFFNPYYFKELEILVPDTEATISLSALAFCIRQAEVNEFTVDKGAFYELKLKEFLDENPDKTQEDFKPPIISMRGSRVLLPSKYACEWKYRCSIEALCQFSFLDTVIYQLTVTFVGDDDYEIKGHIYASQHVLENYVPKVGDDIEGILWMSGYLAP